MTAVPAPAGDLHARESRLTATCLAACDGRLPMDPSASPLCVRSDTTQQVVTYLQNASGYVCSSNARTNDRTDQRAQVQPALACSLKAQIDSLVLQCCQASAALKRPAALHAGASKPQAAQSVREGGHCIHADRHARVTSRGSC